MTPKEPFSTTNQQLAFALATAGCTFASRELEGPAQNIYTLGWLRDRKLGTGLGIEEAAMVAFKQRKAGTVIYYFERDSIFDRAIAAWDEIVAEYQQAELDKTPPILPEISERVVMQVLCVHANNMKHYSQLPFVNRPWVSTIESVRTEEKGESGYWKDVKIKVTGAGKMWKVGAKKVREYLFKKTK
jgi:hypothetical protein